MECMYDCTHSQPLYYMDVIGQLGAPAAFPQIKIPDTHLVLDWVAILAEPDAVRMSRNLLLFIINRATVGQFFVP